MSKPLFNQVYAVTLTRSAFIYVDAESPEAAMKIAESWKDDVDDRDFEDSDVEVDSCDTYPDEAEGYMETIYTENESMDVDEFLERFDAQDPEAVQRGGWDMTNQLELPLTNIES